MLDEDFLHLSQGQQKLLLVCRCVFAHSPRRGGFFELSLMLSNLIGRAVAAAPVLLVLDEVGVQIVCAWGDRRGRK